MKFSRCKGTCLFLLPVLLVSGYLLFHQLGTPPLRIWDESRLAANSIEMYSHGYAMVTTYEGDPDLWNTKPPMLIWIQTTMLHLFGISEWSLRLPSVLAALGITTILFLFVRKSTGNIVIAITASLIPVTSEGFLLWHGSRAADYDAMLTLLLTGAAISFYKHTITNKSSDLYITFLLLALSVLTKSSAGLLFIPGLFLWSIASKHFMKLLRSKHLWIGLLLMVALVASYYLGRELLEPGYLAAVNLNEFSGRYLTANDGNRGGLWFYPEKLLDTRFGYWVFFLVPAILLSVVNPDKRVRKTAHFSLVIWFSYLIVISLSQTKLQWYDLPLYPFFAITIGMAADTIRRWIAERSSHLAKWLHTGILVLVLLMPIKPYLTMAHKVDLLDEPPWDQELYHIQHLYREILAGKREMSGYTILRDDLWQRIQFYHVHASLKGINIPVAFPEEIEPQALVIAYSQSQLHYLDIHFYYETAEDLPWETVKALRIISYREKENDHDPYKTRDEQQ